LGFLLLFVVFPAGYRSFVLGCSAALESVTQNHFPKLMMEGILIIFAPPPSAAFPFHYARFPFFCALLQKCSYHFHYSAVLAFA